MREDIARLVVRAALIVAEKRKVLAAERLPTGVWYAIVDDGKLWFETVYTAYGLIVQWVREPIRLLEGMSAPSALVAQKWKVIGDPEIHELDLDVDRKKIKNIRSAYKRAARKMIQAKETPNQYRKRTDKCPPGHRGNERTRCVDMQEPRKKKAWLKQQREKEKREKEKAKRAQQRRTATR